MFSPGQITETVEVKKYGFSSATWPGMTRKLFRAFGERQDNQDQLRQVTFKEIAQLSIAWHGKRYFADDMFRDLLGIARGGHGSVQPGYRSY